MTWSAAEVSTLASKAARGAGAPAAQAERFGQVAAIHLISGRAPGILQGALDSLPDGPILTYPPVLDRALASLRPGGSHVPLGLPLEPLLSSYVAALPFSARLELNERQGLCLSIDLAKPRPKVPPGRISDCDELMAQMARLAECTFVPESATSRCSGAGAGLSDND